MSSFCSKCGTVIMEDMDKCPQCGCPITDLSNMTTESQEETDKKTATSKSNTNTVSRIIPICGLCVGVLSIILSFVALGLDKGAHHSYSTYGGDAYTGIQNAAAATASNVVDLASIVKFGVFAILFIVGLLTVIHYTKELISK